jgi:OmpA-OmpF porin, OOP family
LFRITKQLIMKKVLGSFILIALFSHFSHAQGSLRAPALGVSFVMNDFGTAQRIRSGSIEKVFRDKSWSKFREMAPGIALTYFKGLHSNIDLASTLAATYVNYPLRNKPAGPSDALLLELDASLNFKMFPESYWVSPYLIAGVGASKYKNYYGAILPLGGGIKVNFFDEAALFVTAQYRVGLTTETTNYHFMYNIGIAGVLHGSK